MLADCSSVSYAVQPPTELKCNPVGKFITLACDIKHNSVNLHNVTWYWSRCVHDAGVNGTAILPEDNSDAYRVQVSNYRASNQLIFRVTNSTLGYYWCEISSAVNVSLRPSIITPVLNRTSLPECTNYSVLIAHNYKFGPECAAKDSPIIYTQTRLHLKTRNTNHTTVLADLTNYRTDIVAVICVEFIILIILSMVLVFIGIYFRKRPSLNK